MGLDNSYFKIWTFTIWSMSFKGGLPKIKGRMKILEKAGMEEEFKVFKNSEIRI